MSNANIVLDVNGIEVIYNHVILVLKGVSLQVPEGRIVALMGGNGAGKTTTLRAVSNLLAGERGAVTKGSIELRGERIEALSTSCVDHMGASWARIHTWDGSKWNFTSDWLQGDDQVIKPLVRATAAKYASEKKLTPRTPEDCQS